MTYAIHFSEDARKYSLEQYTEAIELAYQSWMEQSPSSPTWVDDVLEDLVNVFRNLVGEKARDDLVMGLHAILDEDDSGGAWTGSAAELAAKVRKVLEEASA